MQKNENQESLLMHCNSSYSLAFQMNIVFAIVEGGCSIQQQSFIFVPYYAISLTGMLCYSLAG